MSKKLDDDDDDPFYDEDWDPITATGSIGTYTEYDKENPERLYQTTKIGFVTDDATPIAAKPQRHKASRVRNTRA
jgi:hypothetical protein